MKILHRLLGYCPICGRWFQFSTKQRTPNTVKDEYIVCCKSCYEKIEAYRDELLRDLHKDQRIKSRMMK